MFGEANKKHKFGHFKMTIPIPGSLLSFPARERNGSSRHTKDEKEEGKKKEKGKVCGGD